MRGWHIAALLAMALPAVACNRGTDDLHTRLRYARLGAELSCGRSTVFASEPSDLETLERVDWAGLVAAVLEGEPHERWRAIQILGELGDARAVPSLLLALSDPRGTVRPCLAAESLGRLGGGGALDQLILAAQNVGNEDLRLCATKSLGLLRAKRAVPVLIEAVERRDMLVASAFALARIGDPRGARAVARAAEDPDVRPWLAAPLGEFGLTDVEPALRAIAADGQAFETTRREAGEGLWKTGILTEPDRRAALARVLAESPVSSRRAWAAFRLGDEGLQLAAEDLARALSDPSDPVRLAAAAALLRFDTASETSVLRRIHDPGEAGRYAIAVLGFVGSEQSRGALEGVRDPTRLNVARLSLRWLALRGIRGAALAARDS